MFLVGLTGGIATGKSTASNMFRRLGAYVIEADQVSRDGKTHTHNAFQRRNTVLFQGSNYVHRGETGNHNTHRSKTDGLKP